MHTQCLEAGFYTSRFFKGDHKPNSYSVPGQKKPGLGPAKHSVARISWSTEYRHNSNKIISDSSKRT